MTLFIAFVFKKQSNPEPLIDCVLAMEGSVTSHRGSLSSVPRGSWKISSEAVIYSWRYKNKTPNKPKKTEIYSYYESERKENE